MRNELIELYKLACANPNDNDIVRAYQRAKDRIGPQIAAHEAMGADSLRARVARLEEALKELLGYTRACEGLLNASESGACVKARRALEGK